MNADGSSPLRCRLLTSLDRYGLFGDTQKLHSSLRNNLAEATPSHPEVDEVIDLRQGDWGNRFFQNEDLGNFNILVWGGNIDWETAGWYPPYCE